LIKIRKLVIDLDYFLRKETGKIENKEKHQIYLWMMSSKLIFLPQDLQTA
jgi:hypothetical protein